MLYGLIGLVDQSTADSTLVDPIVLNASAEIAATSPAPVAQPATVSATSSYGGWPVVLALAAAVAGWVYYKHQK